MGSGEQVVLICHAAVLQDAGQQGAAFPVDICLAGIQVNRQAAQVPGAGQADRIPPIPGLFVRVKPVGNADIGEVAGKEGRTVAADARKQVGMLKSKVKGGKAAPSNSRR